MSRAKRGKEKPKKLVQGDDAIESFEADWFDFRTPGIELAKQLHMISESSGVCCGIVGPWGSGKSSFMKLMDEYIRKESSWKNVHTAWFTAWDPGGIQDLGDAMLYYFFRDVAGENQEMADAFKELQEALGIRRSFRERARQALEGVSEALPGTGRAAVAVAGGLLGELDASRKVQRSFERLMDWLEKEKRTVFFFIDDIDRATGDQIRDLLSELKLYISHRRIVAVLGYDEDYVLGALKSPVLPPGIDPKKYLEKIVTVKRNVPIPASNHLAPYATRLINSILGLSERVEELGRIAVRLSFNNPRRLKNLILAFTQFVLSVEYKKFEYENLASMLITTAAVDMGFFADDEIVKAIETGREDTILSAIQEFVKKDTSKSKEATLLIDEVQRIMPEFRGGSVSRLRLAGISSFPRELEPISHRREPFDWSLSLIPILSSAAMQGFKIPPDAVEFSSEIVIPPSTKIERLNAYKKQTSIMMILHRMGFVHTAFSERVCVLSWNQSDIMVLPSSTIPPKGRYERIIVESFFDGCAHFVAEKSFVLWLIDDQGMFPEDYLKELIKRAEEFSKGLKHPFIFQYTPSSKVASLLTFLLSVAGKQS